MATGKSLLVTNYDCGDALLHSMGDIRVSGPSAAEGATPVEFVTLDGETRTVNYFTPASVTTHPPSDRRRRAMASCGAAGA